MSVELGKPEWNDGPGVHALVSSCPPLEVNSTYCYVLLCRHYSRTCIVARHEQRMVGFTAAYVKPDDPDTLFVWQVAVHSSHRGSGIAGDMLEALFPGQTCVNLETTISPDNMASERLFRRFALNRGMMHTRQPFLERNPERAGHDTEVLHRFEPNLSPIERSS